MREARVCVEVGEGRDRRVLCPQLMYYHVTYVSGAS